MANTKIIVAYDQNRGIGYNNTIPWFIPGELKWVADVTKSTTKPNTMNALIMGRKTWESIPCSRRPLSERLNVVISRTLSSGIQSPNLWVFKDLQNAIEQLHNTANIETIFVFGGASLYEQSLNQHLIDEVLVTEVPGEYPSDTFFPELPSYFQPTDIQQTTYENTVVTRTTYTRNPTGQR